ncbi:MAG: hypothetical protein CMJ77_03770 [Planctomycetaceae bacterium]|nr:hypothetical protein [Planctomycetaceae bacterium]
MKVCFVIENLIAAGTELWILRLIERMDRNRVQPLLCLINGSGAQSQALEPVDCPVLRLNLPGLKTHRTFGAAAQLYRFLKQHKVDVVQVHHADSSYLGIPIARLARVPKIVQTKYDIGYWLQGTDLWLHRMLRPWVDVTVANCQACRQASIEQEWSPQDTVEVVDNGIELEPLEKIAPIEPVSGRPHQIGMLANLRSVKDAATYLRAAEILLRTDQGLTFHLLGDGPERGELERLAVELDIDQHVVFHGRVERPAEVIQSLSIGVLCSLSEGLPHALLEFMAAGRPVVATDVGGNSEVVRNGDTGWLVPPRNPEAIATAINQLLHNPTRLVQMGMAARQSVISRFGLEPMTRRFEDFYDRIVDPRQTVSLSS